MDPRLQSCLDIVLDATKGAGEGARVRRTPQQWSAAEVVEHLQRAYLGTARGLEKAVEKNASLATGATLKQRVASFVLVHLGYFPEGRQAPQHVMPTGEVDLAALVEAVRRDLSRLDAAAVKARERFGRAKVLDHPILGAMTVEEWLKFHQVHTRHHEKQIRARLGPATKCRSCRLNAHHDRRCPSILLYLSSRDRTIIQPWCAKLPPLFWS